MTHYEIERLDVAGFYGPPNAWAVLKVPAEIDKPHGRWEPHRFPTPQEAEAWARYLLADEKMISRIVRVADDGSREIVEG